MASIVHPRLLASLRGLFPSSCTIQVPADTNTKGDVSAAPWADLAGHTGLACRVAPAGGAEIKGAGLIYAMTSHSIALAGYYPLVTAHMRALVDGQAYDIEAVEHDGSHVQTRLRAQIVTR